jgi:hypothetical protein
MSHRHVQHPAPHFAYARLMAVRFPYRCVPNFLQFTQSPQPPVTSHSEKLTQDLGQCSRAPTVWVRHGRSIRSHPKERAKIPPQAVGSAFSVLFASLRSAPPSLAASSARQHHAAARAAKTEGKSYPQQDKCLPERALWDSMIQEQSACLSPYPDAMASAAGASRLLRVNALQERDPSPDLLASPWFAAAVRVLSAFQRSRVRGMTTYV